MVRVKENIEEINEVYKSITFFECIEKCFKNPDCESLQYHWKVKECSFSSKRILLKDEINDSLTTDKSTISFLLDYNKHKINC